MLKTGDLQTYDILSQYLSSKSSNHKEVLNVDLWKELDEMNHSGIEWNWVKAHNGNRWNEYVDNLARKCAETV